MVQLEQITKDTVLTGILPSEPVTIIHAEPKGSDTLEITYKDSSGQLAQELLTRDKQIQISIVGDSQGFSFDANGELFKLASEAYRIHLAHLFDPYLAVHTSLIDPLPHQITAVYGEMLKHQPLRFLLADDPGAGKTIMAGLLIKELMARGDVERCLICCPGMLTENWQDELTSKFHLHFQVMTKDSWQNTPSGNWFKENDLVVCRLDQLSRNEVLREKLKKTHWDLVIVDEAHKMSATYWGEKLDETQRYKLGKLLGEVTRHFLLMTATPHNGKPVDFQLFLALLDRDRFEGKFRQKDPKADIKDLYRKTFKEDMKTFDGKKLFPQRKAETINYILSDLEAELYADVTEYVKKQFNLAEKLKKDRKGAIGFALTILQRRLASSPEAIYQSLKRRKERLQDGLEQEEKEGQKGTLSLLQEIPSYSEEDLEDIEDLSNEEYEEEEQKVESTVTASSTKAELKREINILKDLENLALKVKQQGEDKKWEALKTFLLEKKDRIDQANKRNQRKKLILFTEHRATLEYLYVKITKLMGKDSSVRTIQGGMKLQERREVEAAFNYNKEVEILIATDAAGEGINLHKNCHLMINYDLPWNPNRLEQRFGRIHRIGQSEPCHLWNLLAGETREGQVFKQLFDKLEEQRKALGDKVFDVLGRVFQDKDLQLRDLLLQAICKDKSEDGVSKAEATIEDSLDKDKLKKLLQEESLTNTPMDESQLQDMRLKMEKAEALKLQPHFIASFFIEAFKKLGGKIQEREKGSYEILKVPYDIRAFGRRIEHRMPISSAYERIIFDKKLSQDNPKASYVCPGHSILDCTKELILEKKRLLLDRGSILVDESESCFEDQPRVLIYLKHSIQDRCKDKQNKYRLISEKMCFIEMFENGRFIDAGCAPYLDYSPITDAERESLKTLLSSQWLTSDFKKKAENFAIEHFVPEHGREIQERKNHFYEKARVEIYRRLTQEIDFWDGEYRRRKEQEDMGKKLKSSSKYAKEKATELEQRRHRRMDELEREKDIVSKPPQVIGASLIVPRSYLNHAMDSNSTTFASQEKTSHSESRSK